MLRGFPVCGIEEKHQGKIAIVGSGPSVRDLVPEISEFETIWGINGAYGYLVERGITPDFVSVDPSEKMLVHLTDPQRASTFYLASVTHPKAFDALDGFNIKLWHSMAEGLPDDCKPRVIGGTTCITRATCLARMLGWRDITFYGCESSYAEKRNICGEPDRTRINMKVGDEIFVTDMILAHQVSELVGLSEAIPLKFRCGGLTEAMVNAPIQQLEDVVDDNENPRAACQ